MLFIGLLILVHITWNSAHAASCDQKRPVCGNDGKTYVNMCYLIWAKLEDPDLQVLHEGSCNGYFLSGSPDLSESEGDVYSGSKFEGKSAKLQKHLSATNGKVKAIMPHGWPPLGPIQPKQELKADEEINYRFNVKFKST